MLNRFLRTVLLTASLAGAAFAADAAKPEAPPADPVVAKVNGAEIHRSEAAKLYASLPEQVRQLPIDTVFPLLVERLVEQKLVQDAGYAANLQNTDDVKQEVREAESHAVQRAYIRREVEKHLTPAAIEAAYKALAGGQKPQTEIRAAHILLKTEKDAKAVIAKLKKGGDFAAIAKAKSQDTGSASQGGDLGWFTQDVMVEPFAKAAFAMKKGEISPAPVKTEFGWHVIKVEDVRQKPVPSLDEAKSQLEEKLTDQYAEEAVKSLRETAKVETFQADGSPLPLPAQTPPPAPAAKGQ
jgi:peptidyl-prolyl cis-trans isomerase C